MSPRSRSGIADDDWDRVWQDYDRRHPKPVAPAAREIVKPKPLRGRISAMLLALALSLALAPRPASLMTGQPDGGESLVSLSPTEAELPPLSTSVARLAAESAHAACWVLQLDPRRPACP
ncbi:hypothetical protein [Belnapia rosea]|uniref:Uncharacterized protein n=1 Tax=Belnapia rosea TaxID=938405 RepID=A0A1G6SUE3_9PROT|nr:hypothetical protein [Belnapia rosea]SDB60562.1 hypothetical protein SAMN02927895_02400 [Belnapia rosea]SDD20409.1 hypothetical protein SAMN04487779_1005162 [Belnapia rosea]